MKKCFTLVTLLLIMGWATIVVAQTVNVTFQVNMKRAAKTGYFTPVGSADSNKVTIPGGFNNWLNEPPANSTKTMEDPDGDSIYTKTIPLTDAQYEYKYNIGLGWDGKDELGGQPNRKVNKPAADSVLAPVWFDNASGDTVSVTFNVNMKLPAKGIPNFSTRKVYVAGDFNGFTTWSDGAIQMTDPDNDSIYTVTTPAFSGNIKYKFIHSTGAASAGSWETIPDRKTWVPGRAVTITKLWNDQLPVPLASGNIFFEVNMSVAAELGVYNPNVDSVQIRGSFNGWNASEPAKSLLIQDPSNANLWYLDVPFVNSPVGDTSLL